ncbi:hypothetical protein [Rhodococcus sp. SJ-2]
MRAAHPDLDGLVYRGWFTGALCIAFFPPAAHAVPADFEMTLPLDHSGFDSRLAEAAHRIGRVAE